MLLHVHLSPYKNPEARPCVCDFFGFCHACQRIQCSPTLYKYTCRCTITVHDSTTCMCSCVHRSFFLLFCEHARTSIENKSNHYPAPLAWLVDIPLVNTLFQSQLTQYKLWRFYEQIMCLGKPKSK